MQYLQAYLLCVFYINRDDLIVYFYFYFLAQTESMNRGSIVILKNFELEFLTDLHVSIPKESKKAIFKKFMYVCLSVS